VTKLLPRRIASPALLIALLLIPTLIAPSVARAAPAAPRWLATWGASPQGPVPDTLSAVGFKDETVRDIIDTSVGGTTIRLQFANTFGRLPLDIGRAAVGIANEQAGLVSPASGPVSFGWGSVVQPRAGVVPGTNVPLSFHGRTSVRIPPGADVLSDPVALKVYPLEDLAVSIFLPRATGPATWHGDAQQINFVAMRDHALDPGPSAYMIQSRSWYFLDRVDVVRTRRQLGAVVVLGDSITDGYRSSDNDNDRWPNDLARRLDALPRPTLSVVDEGIGGNRLLNDSAGYGDSALSRFNRDVLQVPGVKDVVVLEGTNDIQFSRLTTQLTSPHREVSAGQIIAGYKELIARAHAAGLKIFGGTLPPFQGSSNADAAEETTREAVNHWILTGRAFDGVINFAKTLADPTDPLRLNPPFDSGDHLHPNDAGYRAMASAVNLSMLGQSVDLPGRDGAGKRHS
jgi:lysophospholipase L1-like esterase